MKLLQLGNKAGHVLSKPARGLFDSEELLEGKMCNCRGCSLNLDVVELSAVYGRLKSIVSKQKLRE